VWHVQRARRRLQWWLGEAEPMPRLLIAAALLLDGSGLQRLEQAYSGGRFAAPPLSVAETSALVRLDGYTLDHPAMPDAVRFEIPDWTLPLLKARFGSTLETEMAAMAEPAPFDLRVNLLKATREEARAALAAEGIGTEPTPLSPWGLRVAGRRPVLTTKAFRAGLVEIQDEGSQLVAALVGATPDMRVADFCAGAGGKTLALAMTMRNRGHLVACDVSPARLDAAQRRLRRAGVHNVERRVIEPGGKWLKRHAGSFDRVLVDAPCTASGTWRRNPAARLRLAPNDLAELLPKQAQILDQAAPLVRSGGRLVYATCSLFAEENEAQVSAFIARHPEFAPLPLEHAWALPNPLPGHGPDLVLTPRRHGTDGFFAAVLERRL